MADQRSLAKPQDVVAELYDADEPVRNAFGNAVAAEAIEFSEVFAPTYALFENFYKDCHDGIHRGLVGGLVHGVLDDCLTSVKLLMSGKLSASGNLARQAMEGICMAIMTTQNTPLTFDKEEHLYWKLLESEDKRSEGNRSAWQVLANLDKLGLSEDGANQLKKAIETHHPHSHAGRLGMANRVDIGEGGRMHFGGHFDPKKLDGYKLEMQRRIAICKWANEAINALWPLVKVLPKSAS